MTSGIRAGAGIGEDSLAQRLLGGSIRLGLAIVHHIVELHSGHVRATSPGSGRGSTFTVQLPSIAERPVPAVAASHESLGPPLHDITVLVVDDQEDARELMCAVLGRCGAHVVAVDSPAAALEAMDRCLPDVVLSDLEMPGEDGYSLIKKIGHGRRIDAAPFRRRP